MKKGRTDMVGGGARRSALQQNKAESVVFVGSFIISWL